MKHRRPLQANIAPVMIAFSLLVALFSACSRRQQTTSLSDWKPPGEQIPGTAVTYQATSAWGLPTPRPAGAPVYSPTPDDPHPLPALRKEAEPYTVQSGDTLNQIAERFAVSPEDIVQQNQIGDPNILSIGQELIIPAPTPFRTGPSFKIIPDSELVYGPSSVGFNLEEFIRQQGGFLAYYHEQVNDESLTGSQVIQRVAQAYSINPRLLLAVLQHKSSWLTDPSPEPSYIAYPLGLPNPALQGLLLQLNWAANTLKHGFYAWRANQVAAWVMPAGGIVPIDPTINAGTAAIQYLLTHLYDHASWLEAISMTGLIRTYQQLFGYPFDYAIEPPLPAGLTQPTMQLPFETGVPWAFTGGPHSAWGNGSNWAALDFAPSGETTHCPPSDAWVVAVADGLVLRSEEGVVILDLDGDGFEQTGWVVLYLHIETRHRVQAGTFLRSGEHIGHPSCEGGLSTGTHVHLARRYNGEWIAADQNIPFILDGWVASSSGKEYDGFLERNGQLIEAYDGHESQNEIQR